MKEIPSKITPCPIIEAVVEVRYQSMLPAEAVFGVIYNSINAIKRDEFSLEKLPILQLPEEIRSKDPGLKYSAHYTLKHKELPLTINIGPHVITFFSRKKYQGWDSYFNFISAIITEVFNSNTIQKYERIGVRYINYFDFPIFNKINCSFEMNGHEVLDFPTSIKTERKDNIGRSIIQIHNNTNIQASGINKVGSLIDIDFISDMENKKNDINQILDKVVECHKKEKEIFFGLLKSEFLASYDPKF